MLTKTDFNICHHIIDLNLDKILWIGQELKYRFEQVYILQVAWKQV